MSHMNIFERVAAARLHGVIRHEAKDTAKYKPELHAWWARCEVMELVKPQGLNPEETAFLFNFAGLAPPPRHDDWTADFIRNIPRITRRIARSQGLKA